MDTLGSVIVLGVLSGIIPGLLLEHCGVRKTGFVALFTALPYIAIQITLYHPEHFNGSLFPILVVLFFFIGMLFVFLHVYNFQKKIPII